MGEELTAGQERGEISSRQINPGSVGHVPDRDMPATLPELGLTRKEAAGYKALAKP